MMVSRTVPKSAPLPGSSAWDPGFHTWRVILLFCILLVAYLANGENLGTGDTLPAQQIPFSLIRGHDFYLNEFVPDYAQAALHSVKEVDGRFVSRYPVGASLVALPVYLAAVLSTSADDAPSAEACGKIAASLTVAVSAVVLLLALCRITAARNAFLVSLCYGVGTSSLSLSSQALWQHGASQLCLASALYLLVRAFERPGWAALAGFPLAFAVLCRPTNVLFVLPLTVYVIVQHRGRVLWFVFCALPVASFLAWYNLTHFHVLLYSQFPLQRAQLWATPFVEGFLGLLVSPGRGLFVYSPVALFSVCGFILAWGSHGDTDGMRLLRYCSVGTLLVVLVHSKWWAWWGGLCYGPRLLADVLPAMALAAYPALELISRRRSTRAAGTLLAVWSFAAHFQGAYWDDGRWNGYMTPEGLWDWTDNPLVNPARVLASRTTIAAKGLATSRNHPELVAASYRIEGGPPGSIKGYQVRMRVQVTNTGRAVWLAWPKEEPGTVRMEWSISGELDARQPLLTTDGPLRHDVFPGQTYSFPLVTALPTRPAQYDLLVGVARIGGPSFDKLGCPPLRIPLRVVPRSKAGAGNAAQEPQ